MILILGVSEGVRAGGLVFSIASYNVDSYLLTDSRWRSRKEPSSRAAVADVIQLARPQVLALQEVGSTEALESLRGELLKGGLAFPFRRLLKVNNQEIYCAVLSQFPIVADRSDPNAEFVLYGRSFTVLRGIMEVDIEVDDEYRFTLFNVHLKSNLPVWYADQADFREAEAGVLREKVGRLVRGDPDRNIVVAGDLNDLPNSRTLKLIRSRGRYRLWDIRPTESSLRESKGTTEAGRGVSWTYYFEGKDIYYRYDYLLFSAGMRREWREEGAVIPLHAAWRMASDHRLIVSEFLSQDQ